jgi:hypothetical protein
MLMARSMHKIAAWDASRGGKMTAKDITEATTEESLIRSRLVNLAVEDAGLRKPLLEAASIAARLALDPADYDLRARAAAAWSRIDSVIARHLTTEERGLLPWAESLPDFPRSLIERARKKHKQLLALHELIAEHSFQKGSENDIAAEARNLCVYATTLDDLVAGEERDLFPVLRRVLFRHRQP